MAESGFREQLIETRQRLQKASSVVIDAQKLSRMEVRSLGYWGLGFANALYFWHSIQSAKSYACVLSQHIANQDFKRTASGLLRDLMAARPSGEDHENTAPEAVTAGTQWQPA